MNFPATPCVDFRMKQNFEERIKGLEDREAIMYGFIDELQVKSVRSQVRIIELEERIEMLEKMMGRVIDTLGVMTTIFDKLDQRLDNRENPGHLSDPKFLNLN